MEIYFTTDVSQAFEAARYNNNTLPLSIFFLSLSENGNAKPDIQSSDKVFLYGETAGFVSD